MTDYLICLRPNQKFSVKTGDYYDQVYTYRWIGGTNQWYRVPGGMKEQRFDTLDQAVQSNFERDSTIGRSVREDERFPYELFTGL